MPPPVERKQFLRSVWTGPDMPTRGCVTRKRGLGQKAAECAQRGLTLWLRGPRHRGSPPGELRGACSGFVKAPWADRVMPSPMRPT